MFTGPPLVAGNWKMNGTRQSCRDLARGVVEALGSLREVEVAIFPPYPFLTDAAEAIQGTLISLGAQDLHPAEKGAFTGAVSGAMLLSLGCTYVLAGHSERRWVFGDTDESVREKVNRALASNLRPVLCIGERAEERDSGQGEEVVRRQLGLALEGFPKREVPRLTLAYEPVWAIGTGRPATAEGAAEIHGIVRSDLVERFGSEEGNGVRILYGGSVTAANAREFLQRPEIDGLLVGGASLDADSFSSIAKAGEGTVPT